MPKETKQAAPAAQGIEAQGDGESFDFTVPVQSMDEQTEGVYWLLRRKARLANNGQGDLSAMPDGKVLSRSEVESILGGSIEDVKVSKSCC